MIPLRDTLQTTRKPWVNYFLLTLNIAIFAFQFVSGEFGERLVTIFGFIPHRFFNPEAYGFTMFEVGVTLVTSLFLHGGFVHLAGNMIYLAIFGDDIEESLGHSRYFLFYVGCGTAGSLTHAILFPASTIPSIGASGSIAGVLGAFLLFHPKAKIVTLFTIVVSWAIAEIPAIVFLPIWFFMQFLNGWFSLASAQQVQEVSGVAWWAHVGGFSFGVILGLVTLLVRSFRPRPAVVPGKVI
jgi:membrane associated rhomboid family serine protease